MSPQTISATPTNALATAYSNQKKLAVLSSGREVVVIGDTSTTGQFWWSDDGWATKTNYSADIGGWSDGSIDVYTDSGGTQRIVAVWKQSGTSGTGPTGGARTDGWVYSAVGTLNAGATTITWGAALNVYDDTSHLYLDVAVTGYSTGGRALISAARIAGATNFAHFYQHDISSSGVISQHNGVVPFYTGGGYGSATVYTWPSVCLDPSGNGHSAWSAGTTGAGKGIRYAKLGFASGNWTLSGSEVEVDNTRYATNASRWVACRWNAHDSMVVIGGLINTAAAASNDLMQYESTNFTAFTTRTLGTGLTTGAVYEGGLAIDAATGDSYFAGRNSGQSDVAYYQWVRATTTLGSRTVIESANNTSPYVYAWARSFKIGFVWTALASSPYTVKADKVDILQNTHQLVNAA
jgi:hypothetical protein